MQLPIVQTDRTSRRQFLAGCSTFALASTLGPASLVASVAGKHIAALEHIAFAHFSTQQGSVFRVWLSPESSVVLLLGEAVQKQEYPMTSEHTRSEFGESFSLMFLGARDQSLEQNTYLFEHPQIGHFPMFIVPLKSNSNDYICYEAIFNRRSQNGSRRENHPGAEIRSPRRQR